MNYTITVLPGDGIGPEVTEQAVAALGAVAEKFNISLKMQYALIGGAAIDASGVPLPGETIKLCQSADAVLLGAVGGPQWDALPGDKRPEKGLLGIRAALKLFANLRPAIVHAPLRDASPLKPEILGDSLDIMVVRELTGGIYFGERGRGAGGCGEGCCAQDCADDYAWDTEKYSAGEVRRVAKVAFELAAQRSGRLCSVDKANVLESSRLWRETVTALAQNYPAVQLSHLYVDNAAMQLVRAPQQFDVIVTSNMFGDILSDEASQITGSIGMLPSASLGDTGLGLYEPVHGSAPDIAGKDIANPIAAILSVAMALRWSLKQPQAAVAIENAVAATLEDGLRTADIAAGGGASTGGVSIGTSAMGKAIIDRIGQK